MIASAGEICTAEQLRLQRQNAGAFQSCTSPFEQVGIIGCFIAFSAR
jgi:hypothetical protein